VITCYNHARFLGFAITSAICQTLRGVEVIVVDDGSTDDTADVARTFPGVSYIFQRNQGLSAARNTGLAAAKGPYVCFLDADDLLLPNALERGLQAFRQQPDCAFVYGDSCDVDVNGVVQSPPRGYRVASDHYRALLEGNFIGMHATVLYRRDILQVAGGFDPRWSRCEDYETYLRLARRYPVREYAGTVAHYRQHDTNMSRSHAPMMDAALAALRAQAPITSRDPALHRAAQVGIANWRNYYGDLLLEDFRWSFCADGLTLQTIRLSIALIRRCPRKLAGYLLQRVRRRIGRILAAEPCKARLDA
jgi:glycosyltransferase involved in cell wall biosynthesis